MHHRAAAQQADGAVRPHLGVVARHRVPDAVDGPEGGRRLGLVLVVAHRDPPAQGQHTARSRARLDVPAVGVEDPDLGAEGEPGGAGRGVARRDRGAHPEGLRRGEGVDQQHPRVVAEEALLGLLAPHDPRRDDPDQAGQVPPAGVGVEGGQDGLGEDVAHDDQAVDLLALHGVQELDRIELPGGEGDHPAALAQALEGGEPAGAVHERAGRQQGHAAAAPFQLGADVVGTAVLGVAPEARAVQPGEEVVLAPHDALGHPGGPAGVEQVEVVGAPAPGCADPPRSVERRRRPADGGLLVGHGPGRAGCGAVVDPQPRPDPGEPGPDPLDPVREVPWNTTATVSALSHR